MLKLKIFISSPGDVVPERALADLVIKRLNFEYRGVATLEPFFWEEHGYSATGGTYQNQIPLTSTFHLCIFILWSRLGTPLPSSYQRQDGTSYRSGTEYEFEHALKGYGENGFPDCLVYRKTSERMVPLGENIDELRKQQLALESFIQCRFRGEDGSYSKALNEFTSAAQFEKCLADHLKRRIDDQLTQIIPEQGKIGKTIWKGKPFRGLSTFEFEDAIIFCGRTQAITELLDRLQRQAEHGHPFVLVLGMSGSGKSSLVRSGLLPLLVIPGVIEGIGLWRRAMLRPGDQGAGGVFDALAIALLSEQSLPELRSFIEAAQLAKLLHESPDGVAPLLAMTLNKARQAGDINGEARLVLVVDQLEELFAPGLASPAEQADFIRALGTLVKGGMVWVIATLRSDFFKEAEHISELRDLMKDEGHYHLSPPTFTELSQMIRQPAQMAGLIFEENAHTGEKLDEVLRDAAIEDPAALPLLEFTLEQLYLGRGENRMLTFEAYQALGGLEGALSSYAEEILTHIPAITREALPDLFAALVSLRPDSDGIVTRKRVPVSQFTSQSARELLEALIQRRLLITDQTEYGEAVVSLTHEALLLHWSVLRQWIEDNRAFLAAKAHLASAETLWRETGESDDRLLRSGKPLREAEQLLSAHRQTLSNSEIRFITHSRHALIRRQRRRVAFFTIPIVIMLAIGLGVWDAYYREHVEYFNNALKRWNRWEGYGPISRKEVAHRAFAVKITSQGSIKKRVTSLEIVNGRGRCPIYLAIPFNPLLDKYLSFAPLSVLAFNNMDACRGRLEYDEQDQVKSEFIENREGQILQETQFLRPDQAIIKGISALRATVSGASYVRLEHISAGSPLAGLIREQQYTDSQGQAKPDNVGCFGYRNEYNASGLLSMRSCLNDIGQHQSMFTPSGLSPIASVGMSFLPSGLFTNQRYLDINETLLYSSLLIYDQHDNFVKSKWSDGDKQPIRVFGLTERILKYDDQGNLIELSNYDEQKQLSPDIYGIARLKISYDENGFVTELSAYNSEEKLALLHPEGYARVRLVNDDAGRTLEQHYYGVDGMPQVSEQGCIGVAATYNAVGQLSRTICLGQNDKPVADKEGIAKRIFDYDANGHQSKMTYLGEDNKPAFSSDGYASVIWGNDERGNHITERYEDVGQHRTHHKDGYFGFFAKYDDANHLFEKVYFGQSKEHVTNNSGVAKIVSTYDQYGYLAEEATYGLRDEPVLNDEGYFKVSRKYDFEGHVVSLSYFGLLNELVDVSSEFYGLPYKIARITTKFDHVKAGSMYEYRFYDHQEQPVLVKGCFLLKRLLDKANRLLEESCFDAKENPIRDKDGYARINVGYDKNGNKTLVASDERDKVIGKAFVDNKNQPIRGEDGYAKKNVFYDEQGNQTLVMYDERDNEISIAYYDEKGQRTRGKDGYAFVTNDYDESGNLIRIAYFDEQGALTRKKNEYAAWAYRYNPQGKLISEAYYDEKGQLTRGKDGYAFVTNDYDESGNLIRIAYFDEQGALTRKKNEYALWSYRYNPQGKLISEAYYDEKGQLTRGKDGYAFVTNDYDESGNLIRIVYFDEQGALTRNKDGYALWSYKYNPQGKLIAEAYFDEKGQLTRGKDGYAFVSNDYDESGNLIRIAYFDEKEQPIRGKDGYAELSNRYDENGNLIRIAYFDKQGNPTRNKDGLSKWTGRYNPQGKLIAGAFFDENGQPIRGTGGYAKERARYNENGNLIEIAYFNELGNPTRSKDGYAKQSFRYDDSGQAIKSCAFDEAGIMTKAFIRKVRIADILPGSQAGKMGLTSGDFLEQFDGAAILDMKSSAEMISKSSEKPHKLIVLREGKAITVTVAPGKIGVRTEYQMVQVNSCPINDSMP